ncbi:Histone-lysine N-methyltransferase ATXR2 [Acorus gramineus]|uniref:Histone-lysine N-methyltransferase ATXR2 n=1 Tax=Acorus gramineus TaxID=55184 RepID=A0AAV9BU46_ACOGR|nr:Histone-lysine N-methyltransferase ATXR2 [Acorus gramineus]
MFLSLSYVFQVDCFVCSHCFQFIGSVELQIGRKLYLQGLGLSDKNGCDFEAFSPTSKEDVPKNHNHSELCSSSASRDNSAPSDDTLESLMNGTLSLPYSEKFSLPPVISCLGGCEEEHYCSKSCAEADWELFHSILCTGKSSRSLQRNALVKFVEHANKTNDIFILAAKAISFTILRYKKLKITHLENQIQNTGLHEVARTSFSLLMEAWRPISMGFKKRWWDCIALPDDIDSSREASFRMQIKELAFESLQLLKEAIFEKEYAPLFSLEIYGHVIGMFELNNLDLVVASPVEDYFIYIDELPPGTAFFPLQSCMNHSCCPNAKAFKREEDRDGQATIIALRTISKGEEITISYIDEDLPYDERQALLADYGFRCQCPKCSGGL